MFLCPVCFVERSKSDLCPALVIITSYVAIDRGVMGLVFHVILTSRPRRSGRQCADDVSIFVNKIFVFWLKFHWYLFLKVNSTTELAHVMTQRRLCDRWLSESRMAIFTDAYLIEVRTTVTVNNITPKSRTYKSIMYNVCQCLVAMGFFLLQIDNSSKALVAVMKSMHHVCWLMHYRKKQQRIQLWKISSLGKYTMHTRIRLSTLTHKDELIYCVIVMITFLPTTIKWISPIISMTHFKTIDILSFVAISWQYHATAWRYSAAGKIIRVCTYARIMACDIRATQWISNSTGFYETFIFQYGLYHIQCENMPFLPILA